MVKLEIKQLLSALNHAKSLTSSSNELKDARIYIQKAIQSVEPLLIDKKKHTPTIADSWNEKIKSGLVQQLKPNEAKNALNALDKMIETEKNKLNKPSSKSSPSQPSVNQSGDSDVIVD